MIELIDRKEFFRRLKISSTTYYAVTDPKSPKYIEDFPRPVKLFTENKLRFSVLDLERFIRNHSNMGADTCDQ